MRKANLFTLGKGFAVKAKLYTLQGENEVKGGDRDLFQERKCQQRQVTVYIEPMVRPEGYGYGSKVN
jgi:hypothetical protein